VIRLALTSYSKTLCSLVGLTLALHGLEAVSISFRTIANDKKIQLTQAMAIAPYQLLNNTLRK
jgi:hypothetical protein